MIPSRAGYLCWYLRLLAIIDCLALVVPFLPRAWLTEIHGQLGFGAFPDDPMMGYLARSSSIMYGMHGILLWFVSRDVPRYLQLINLIGLLALAQGGLLVWLDWREGMPHWWIWMEGPLLAGSGAIMLLLVWWTKVDKDSAK